MKNKRVTVQGPVKKLQMDEMSHRGGDPPPPSDASLHVPPHPLRQDVVDAFWMICMTPSHPRSLDPRTHNVLTRGRWRVCAQQNDVKCHKCLPEGSGIAFWTEGPLILWSLLVYAEKSCCTSNGPLIFSISILISGTVCWFWVGGLAFGGGPPDHPLTPPPLCLPLRGLDAEK